MGIEKFWYNHDGVNETSIHLEHYDQVSCNPYNLYVVLCQNITSKMIAAIELKITIIKLKLLQDVHVNKMGVLGV